MQKDLLDIKIEKSWKKQLDLEFSSSWFVELAAFIKTQQDSGKNIYPDTKHIFKAFDATPFNQVKVVVLGQDPYHGPGQAAGLCFSVPAQVKNPPSLVNIFKEIESETGQASVAKVTYDGDLTCWAEQGVLLLNSSLTVEHGKAGSHAGKGWDKLTDAAISKLSDNRDDLVFMLWGNFARGKKILIDSEKHMILEAPHPSPLSAHRGFFGCNHFISCNEYLEQHHIPQIIW